VIVAFFTFPRKAELSRMNFFPSHGEGGEKVPSESEADEGLPRATTNAVVVETPRSPSSALRAPSPRLRGEKEELGDPYAIALPSGGREGRTRRERRRTTQYFAITFSAKSLRFSAISPTPSPSRRPET